MSVKNGHADKAGKIWGAFAWGSFGVEISCKAWLGRLVLGESRRAEKNHSSQKRGHHYVFEQTTGYFTDVVEGGFPG